MTIEEYYHEAKKDYSPGPWYEANTAGDHQGLVISENTGENIAVSYDKKNAALIAKSPEMVEAIERLLGCPALNFDDLEPEDIAAFKQGYELIQDYIE